MMKNKCTIEGSDNTVIQNSTETDIQQADQPNTWTDPAVTILCVFNFLLGVAAYKFLLWRWLP
jgi:hypothetical protein